jgi:hypothetical protein
MEFLPPVDMMAHIQVDIIEEVSFTSNIVRSSASVQGVFATIPHCVSATMEA